MRLNKFHDSLPSLPSATLQIVGTVYHYTLLSTCTEQTSVQYSTSNTACTCAKHCSIVYGPTGTACWGDSGGSDGDAGACSPTPVPTNIALVPFAGWWVPFCQGFGGEGMYANSKEAASAERRSSKRRVPGSSCPLLITSDTCAPRQGHLSYAVLQKSTG